MCFAKNVEQEAIEEISNEVDTNDQKTNTKGRNDPPTPTSSSNESDYINEENPRYQMNIVQSPVVKQLDPEPDPMTVPMHPFMLEAKVEEKRRMSSVIPSIDAILSYNKKIEEEGDTVNSNNFDENYLMFGGDKYTKVGNIKYICIG